MEGSGWVGKKIKLDNEKEREIEREREREIFHPVYFKNRLEYFNY